MALLDVALYCVRRGWYVFPCVPRAKRPLGGLVPNGVLDASKDESQIRAWWAAKPNANVAIACGPSGLSVVDCDHGNQTETDAREWMLRASLPETYTVHTGRRLNKEGSPEYGVQLYYADTMPSVGEFSIGGGTGQVKSIGGYVMAAGSIHPNGEAYEVLTDRPIAPVPSVVRSLKVERKPVEDDGQPITENRNIRLTSIAGKLRNAGLSAAALEVALLQVNADRCDPPLDEDEVERIAANAAKWELPKPDAVAIIGKPVREPLKDWRTLFHTLAETENAPEPKFFIDKFLEQEGIIGLVGPSRARKSIIALNVIHSLLTGEPLFGRFPVVNRPERVVYLCPESGLGSLSRRLKRMGLARFVGESLFYTSMNSDPIELDDPALLAAFDGAVAFVDTAIRFFKGDENSAQDMKRFGSICHSLIRNGAESVVLLHHTAKGASEITLESGRGSGDFGAFLTFAWGTTLENYDDALKSASR